jgi:hypothetical protein
MRTEVTDLLLWQISEFGIAVLSELILLAIQIDRIT